MANPTLRMELKNGAAWVNAGNVVKQLAIGREGYRPELAESRPGDTTIVVQNDTRLFDPDHVAGTHFGYLDAGCPVRVIATWLAVDYTLFTGYIDRISQGYDSGNRWAIATITAVDDMSKAAQSLLPSGYFAEVQRADAGATYLPLDEPTEQTYPVNPFALNDAFSGQWVGSTRQDAELMPSATGGKRFSFVKNALIVPPFRTQASGWHLSFWYQFGKLPGGTWTRRILQPGIPWNQNDASGNVLMVISDTGAISFDQAGTAGAAHYVFPAYSGVGADGAQHFLVIEGVPGIGINFFLDGQILTPVVTSGATNTKELSANAHYFAGDQNVIDELEMSLGHIVSARGTGYNDRLTFVGITGTINTTPTFWDKPGQRIAWCLAQAGITAGTIDEGAAQLTGVRGKESPIEHIRNVAASDGGFFWIDRAGLGQYRSPISGAVVAAFSDAVGGIRYQGLEPVRDGSRRVTAARAKWRGIIIARYDSGLPSPREVEFESLNLQPSEAYSRCVAIVLSLQAVGSQYPSLSFMPARGVNWVTAFGLDLGQLASITRTPEHVGAATFRVCAIEGIKFALEAHMSKLVVSLALGVPGPQNGFILDVSLLDTGVLF